VDVSNPEKKFDIKLAVYIAIHSAIRLVDHLGEILNFHYKEEKQVCELDLENPVFSHGQLYVAISRVGKPSDLFIYAPEGKTKNIVYAKALE